MASGGSRSSTARLTAPRVSAVWGAAITKQSLSAASRGRSPSPPTQRTPVGPPRAGRRRTPATTHAERDPPAGDRAADAAQSEHAEPQLRKLTHRDREIDEFRPGPPARCLKLAQAVEASNEVADRGDHPIGDWLGMDAGRVGEHDVSPPKMRQTRTDPRRHRMGPAERI